MRKKKVTTFNRIALIVPAVIIFGICWSCFGLGEKPVNAEQERYAYRNLLLLPVKNAAEVHGEGQIGRCAICGASFLTGPVSPNAAGFVTDAIKSLLMARTAVTYISEEEYRDMRARLLVSKAEETTELEIITLLGKELGADAILTGNVYRFQERVGSDYAAETPASIGIELDLIETEKGLIRWNRRYEDTQRALSDNLLSVGSFFKRKGKWLTAEELATEGIQHLMETIPIVPKNEK